jgi:hypothetical protein
LESFVRAPVVRTLLALGPQASIRFYDTVDQQGDEGNRDIVRQRYAVTYEEEGEKKTFFVDVQMMRQELADRTAGWSIFPPELVTDPASIR